MLIKVPQLKTLVVEKTDLTNKMTNEGAAQCNTGKTQGQCLFTDDSTTL